MLGRAVMMPVVQNIGKRENSNTVASKIIPLPPKHLRVREYSNKSTKERMSFKAQAQVCRFLPCERLADSQVQNMSCIAKACETTKRLPLFASAQNMQVKPISNVSFKPLNGMLFTTCTSVGNRAGMKNSFRKHQHKRKERKKHNSVHSPLLSIVSPFAERSTEQGASQSKAIVLAQELVDSQCLLACKEPTGRKEQQGLDWWRV